MIKKIGFGLIGLLGGIASAQAGMIVDTIDQVDMLGWGDQIERKHDLTDNTPNAFVVGGDEIITGGTFTIEYWDDYNEPDTSAPVNFYIIALDSLLSVFEGAGGFPVYWEGQDPSEGGQSNSVSPIVTAILNSTGMVSFFIEAELGDFTIGATTLRVDTLDTRIASVPEPGVLMLLSMGLVGLRLARPKAT